MRISVVICTYNYGHFLPHALTCLAQQTFSDVEVVIIDDGSTDDTDEIVRSFSSARPDWRYVRKAHSGLADSRNTGVEKSTGTHVAFLDSDDLWAPNYLRTVHDALVNNPRIELAVTDGYRLGRSGLIAGTLFPARSQYIEGPIGNACDLFAWFPFASPSATTLSKDLFRRVGGFANKLPNGAEDWHWYIRAAKAGAFIKQIARKVVVYRQHDANITVLHPEKMFLGWLAIYDDLLKEDAEEDPTIAGLGRKLTYPRLLKLFARTDANQARMLIKQTAATFGEDRFLRALRMSTYVGSCWMAYVASTAKRRFMHFKNLYEEHLRDRSTVRDACALQNKWH